VLCTATKVVGNYDTRQPVDINVSSLMKAAGRADDKIMSLIDAPLVLPLVASVD